MITRHKPPTGQAPTAPPPTANTTLKRQTRTATKSLPKKRELSVAQSPPMQRRASGKSERGKRRSAADSGKENKRRKMTGKGKGSNKSAKKKKNQIKKNPKKHARAPHYMELDIPKPSPPAGCVRRAEQFLTDGFCHLKTGLTLPQVLMCRREVYRMFAHNMDIVKRLGLQDDLERKGFSTFKLRHTGRYDLEIKDFDKPSFSFLRGDAPWLPLVQSILGKDAVLCNTGVMLSLPESSTQPWHSDGDHLTTRKHYPPHCVNVFVPLVNLTEQNGGTEMVPKTHILGDYDADHSSTTILANAGECILFDFRLRHRGLANKAQTPRPLMYITYCVPNWKDSMNFNKRRYLKLPYLKPNPELENSIIDPNANDHWQLNEKSNTNTDKRVQEQLKISKIRAARIKHRELASKGIRACGMSLYVSAPVLARDKTYGWFPAQVVQINESKKTLRIHFNGWHKRFDFTCSFNSDGIKPCKVDLLFNGKDAIEE